MLFYFAAGLSAMLNQGWLVGGQERCRVLISPEGERVVLVPDHCGVLFIFNDGVVCDLLIGAAGLDQV